MKVGDLVRVQNAYVNRVGLITNKAEQKRCFVVRFCDGNSPIQSSYHIRVIRKLK